MQSGNATHSNPSTHLWVHACLVVNLNANIIIFRLSKIRLTPCHHQWHSLPLRYLLFLHSNMYIQVAPEKRKRFYSLEGKHQAATSFNWRRKPVDARPAIGFWQHTWRYSVTQCHEYLVTDYILLPELFTKGSPCSIAWNRGKHQLQHDYQTLGGK
jgi:hypothetical protein